MTLEVPKWKSESEAIKEKVLEFLRIGLIKSQREMVMLEFRMRYPVQVKKAEESFHQYYRKRLKLF